METQQNEQPLMLPKAGLHEKVYKGEIGRGFLYKLF